MNRVDLFPYDSNADDYEFLPDVLRDIDSDVKSTLKTFFNNNMNEIIFAQLNINFIRNRFAERYD